MSEEKKTHVALISFGEIMPFGVFNTNKLLIFRSISAFKSQLKS